MSRLPRTRGTGLLSLGLIYVLLGGATWWGRQLMGDAFPAFFFGSIVLGVGFLLRSLSRQRSMTSPISGHARSDS